MHKLYSTKAGGGRRELKLGALHKRGAAYERHDERGTRRGRWAENNSARNSQCSCRKRGHSSDTRPTSTCVCNNYAARTKYFDGYYILRGFFDTSRIYGAQRHQDRKSKDNFGFNWNAACIHTFRNGQFQRYGFWLPRPRLTAEVPA